MNNFYSFSLLIYGLVLVSRQTPNYGSACRYCQVVLSAPHFHRQKTIWKIINGPKTTIKGKTSVKNPVKGASKVTTRAASNNPRNESFN